MPVQPRSAQWLSHMSTGGCNPDFGPSYGDGPNYGIPITTVGLGHAEGRGEFDYADESNRVGYPFGADTRSRAAATPAATCTRSSWTRRTCRLYETWNTRIGNGRWHAGSGATWSLKSNTLRPNTWTSADAAGLPILPGLLRWTR